MSTAEAVTKDIGDTANPIAKIAKLKANEVLELWSQTVGSAPCPSVKASFLLPVLAYEIQRRNDRGGSERQKPLFSFSPDQKRKVLYKPGSRIVREWRGVIHEVTITADGFEYAGEHYRSLSPIATKITSTRWSGPAFFGLQKRNPKG